MQRKLNLARFRLKTKRKRKRKNALVVEKLNFLKEFIDRHGLSEGEIAYIGDDMNDYECMEFLYSNKGLTGCPQDTAGKIKLVSSHICSHDGGKGAVREFIEFLAEQA